MDLVLLAQDVTWGGRTGDAIHLRELARHLARRGHTIRVIARGGKTLAPEVVEGVQVYPLESSHDLALSFVRRPILLRTFIRVVADHRPDLVYSRGFGYLSEALTARGMGLPIVFEVNGDAIAERESLRGRPLPRPVRAVALWSARHAFGVAMAIVAVTETLRLRLVQEFRVSPEKIRIVPNAVDTELFHPMDSSYVLEGLGQTRRPPAILFVGTLEPWQGVDYLLKAFAEMPPGQPECILLIVGDGQEGPRLRALAAKLGIQDRVRFAGAVPHERIPWYVAASDVCVAPLTRERLRSGSSAMKIYEYLSGARPVVASRIPGLEFLEAEDLGKLVPPEDSHSLANSLAQFLADDTWRRNAGTRGRTYVVRQRSWQSVAQAVEDVCSMAVAA